MDIDRAHAQINLGQWQPAEEVATQVLRHARAEEALTRAKAYFALGRAYYWHVDNQGRFDEKATRQAGEYLDRAANLFRGLGMRSALAGPITYRALWVNFAQADCQEALRLLEEALGHVGGRPRRRAYILTARAEVFLELGRHDEGVSDLMEVLRVADRLDDETLYADGYWKLAIAASYRGDGEATLGYARQVEAHRGDWWEHASAAFQAEVADQLDRVGYQTVAWEYLGRAMEEPKDSEALIAMSEAALLARHGDPRKAEEKLVELPRRRIDPREYWRMTLLRAYAALRLGDRRAAALAAQAFEEAARLGLPELPLVRERQMAEELLGLAVETGEPAALALEASSLPVLVAVLGRFELTRGGRAVPLAAGQSSQLLKLIALRGGRAQADQAIEALWPEAEPEVGRNRLRTVMNRLRSSAGEVVARDGELLVLAPGVRVDLALFSDESRRALALGLGDPGRALALARSALARYRGEVLPDDPYEAWSDDARYAARRTALDLLDLCSAAATALGDLDELRLAVERTIEMAPYDEDRYLRAVSVLVQQGRRGAALSVVRRAKHALSEMGIALPSQLVAFEKLIVR